MIGLEGIHHGVVGFFQSPLLVDKNGFVLNYEEDGDLSYLEIFKAAESLNSDYLSSCPINCLLQKFP